VDESPAFRIAAEAVRGTLGVSTDVDACVALAARIDGLLEQAHESFRDSGASIACSAGCTFCCHLRVMVMPHEAIALFRHLGSGMPRPTAERVRARLRERPRAGAEAASKPCAFLVDGLCSAYEVRPSACASFHSLSRDRCRENFEGSAAAGATPVLQSFQYVATEMEAGVEAALADAGLSPARIELQEAVGSLLRDPSLIARWRSGRDLGRR
jgi:Fe-S-cluster containining protein